MDSARPTNDRDKIGGSLGSAFREYILKTKRFVPQRSMAEPRFHGLAAISAVYDSGEGGPTRAVRET